MMRAVAIVFTHMVDEHGGAGVACFFAQRSGDIEAAARLEAEFKLVQHRAGGPGILGDVGDAHEAQPGHGGDGFQDLRHRADGLDLGDAGRCIDKHGTACEIITNGPW
ncbi:hypothetical protein [Massilia yuzhufengensis]|uniref:hypothetical protein n=1 Tax=Massilia yuzhufengensis TaxID=1164594 RepID=UPI0015A5B9B4|nr:hypothetical protein [Massilia yuzhufengensis]